MGIARARGRVDAAAPLLEARGRYLAGVPLLAHAAVTRGRRVFGAGVVAARKRHVVAAGDLVELVAAKGVVHGGRVIAVVNERTVILVGEVGRYGRVARGCRVDAFEVGGD